MKNQIQIQYIKTEDLIPYIKNPKKHPRQQVDLIASSIKEFGFLNPIIVDKDNEIVAGHGRLLAAKKLGLEVVPVIKAEHLTPAQIKAYRILDNKAVEIGEWDDDLLKVELKELEEMDFDLALTGFTDDELDELLEEFDELNEEDNKQQDEVPQVNDEIPPFTLRGDLWILGEHRLLCGDSTNKEDVDKLMKGEKADMVFTDPPYNVNYSGSGEKTSKNIKNDNLDNLAFANFLKVVFQNYFSIMKKGSPIYVCHADQKPMIRAIFETEFNEFFKQSATIIWVKNNAPMGWQDYRSKHEPILYGWKEGEHWFYGDRTQTTVWEVSRDNVSDYVHPTQKPVALIEIALKNSSKKGDMVVDFFGGSGSTLIACEKTKRKARLMELDEHYCDVIVKRYIDYTGRENIKLIREGREIPFQEIKTEFLNRFKD